MTVDILGSIIPVIGLALFACGLFLVLGSSISELVVDDPMMGVESRFYTLPAAFSGLLLMSWGQVMKWLVVKGRNT